MKFKGEKKMKIIEKLKSKTNIAGKQISVFMVMFVLMASIGTAALLSSYGTITGEANVTQAVDVTGGDLEYTIGNSPAQAGNTYTSDVFSVKNNANNPVTITLDTKCNNSIGQDDGTQQTMSVNWSTVGGSGKACDGIVTSYFGTVNLSTKDVDFGNTPWTQNYVAKATVMYTLVGNTFTATVTEGVIADYELIYYKDNSDRFNSPAQAIQITADIGSLPYSDDGNVDEFGYCAGGSEGEDYTHCHGGKMWYVPSNALDNCTSNACDIDWTQADDFLFETDLITYTKGTDNKITLPANGGGFDFVVENALDPALKPDTYTLTTDVSPA